MAGEEDIPPPPAEGASPGRSLWHRARVRAIKTVALLLLGTVALVVAIVFGIDTGPGHRFVADQIGALRFDNGMRITVGRIEGSLYGKMTLRNLSVRDTRGEFLFSPEVRIDWRPFAYLEDHVDVRSASARRMVLRRVPVFRKTPPAEGPLLPDFDVDVGTLRIDRFVSEPAVSGERRVVRIEGRAHIADGRAQVTAQGATIAVGGAVAGKEGGDRFALVLDAVPSRKRLAIGLDLDAPASGLIASLAGLDEPLRARIKGKGDWTAWNGALDADLSGSELARLALTARSGTFAVRGPARLARLFSGTAARLLGPVTRIDLAAVIADRRAALSGGIESDRFVLTPDGTLDFSANRFDRLNLAFELRDPSAIADNLRAEGLRGTAVLDGDFRTPELDYRLDARRLVINRLGVEDLTASGAARIGTDHTLIPVAGKARMITGLDAVTGGTLGAVTLNGDLAVQGTRILSDNMRLKSDRLDAGLTLVADLRKGFYAGAIDGRIDDYRLASVGIFDVQTALDLRGEARGFVLEGTVKARSTRLLNPQLEEWLGGNLAASAKVRYEADGLLRFSALRLAAPELRVTSGTGTWSREGRLTLDAAGLSQRYGPVGIRMAGTIDNPNAHVTAQSPGLGIGLVRLDARITGLAGGYRFDLTGETDYGPLTADVTLGRGDRGTLAVNRASLSGVDFAGNLVRTAAGPYAGRLTANGNGVGGVLRLEAQGQYQAVIFNLRARNASFAGPARLAIGTAIVDGRAVLSPRPTVVAEAQLSGMNLGAFDLAAARVAVDYRDGRGKARALVEGFRGVPFRLGVNADFAPDLWRVALQGRVRGQTIKTIAPARIVPDAQGYRLLPSTLSFGGGTARLAGRYGPGLTVQSRLEGIDMALINAFLPGYGIGGKASGSLDFEQAGPGAFPHADARIAVTGFTRTTASSVSQPVDVSFAGKLDPGGGDLRAVLRQRGSVIGRMAGTLRPLPAGAGDWSARLLEAPLGGGIRYNGPADTLFSFLGQTAQAITGPIGLAADFSCRISEPCLNGVIRGRDLTYENNVYGTRLTDLDVSGAFNGNSLELTSLTAKAGEGTVSLSGRISLAAQSGYPMDLTARLDKARLARSEALSATATGTLRLTKQAGAAALLSGELRLPETRYRIVREGAAQVPRLTGVRFRPGTAAVRVTGDEPAQPGPGIFSLIRLDLHLRAPEKLHVTGMGLDSEWSARFDLAGTAAAPILTGKVELVRGNLDFAGHAFDMQKGLITFTGGRAIDPTVAITATDRVEDIDVSVNVTGRALNPQVDFSSVPALPDDEVLSRILFGSSIANLSAIQAVQLASSLNSLRGSGGGLNPLGKLRSAAGIDRLRILAPDEAQGRGTALAAGQYITDDIYVELITDARGFTATQLEVSVTRWLSIISQAGGSGANSVNVRIRKDY